MLNELLPYKQPQQKNPQNPQSDVSADVNLLGKPELFKSEDSVRLMMRKFYAIIIVICCTVCVILLAFNYYYSTKLDQLNKVKEGLVSRMEAGAVDIKQARLLQTQINQYKRILAGRKKMSLPVERVFSITNEHMELLSFTGKPDTFIVIASSKDPSSVVKVLYQLINSGVVQQIILKSAEVDSDTKVYRVTMEGVYK